MIEIYIINVKSDKGRYERTLKEFEKIEYPKQYINRFDAITYDKIDKNYKNHIHQISKYILPEKLIAISLSHIKLSKYLYKKNINYALICEDDIKFDKKIDLNSELNKIIQNYPKDFDIIQIYYQGLCNKNFNLCGSGACYLISRSGMLKMSTLKFNYHIDINFQSKYFNIYQGPLLCSTYEKLYGNKLLDKELIGKKSIYFWYNQHVFKLPFINYNINVYQFIFFILLLLLFIIFIKNKLLKYLLLFYFINVITFIIYSYNINDNNFIKKINYLFVFLLILMFINNYKFNLIKIILLFYILNIYLHYFIYTYF